MLREVFDHKVTKLLNEYCYSRDTKLVCLEGAEDSFAEHLTNIKPLQAEGETRVTIQEKSISPKR